MSDTKHTPGPWRADERSGCVALYAGEKQNCLSQPGEFFIAFWMYTDNHEANRRSVADFNRAAACVNACEGINPEAVPDLVRLAEMVSDGCAIKTVVDHAAMALDKAKQR